MSRSTRTTIFTEKLFELQEAVENDDKGKFKALLKENSLSLRNCSCGDSILSPILTKVCFQAMEKFV